jgi:transcriptional regulator with XRE-family HTH domain
MRWRPLRAPDRVSVSISKLKRFPSPSAELYSAIADFSNRSDTYVARCVAEGPSNEDSRLLDARVRRRAKALGIPLTHVPQRAGVSSSHFWAVLKGTKKPTVAWLRKLAAGLECDVSELILGEVPKLPAPPRVWESRRVPLLSVRAAAEAFLGSTKVEPSGWVTVPGARVVKEGMFATAVSGRSMEPVIGDGAICLFRLADRRNPGRVPDGRIVLAHLRDARDPESGGQYTVKRFKVTGRREGRVAQVCLQPINRVFEPLLLPDEPMRQLTVIAEFLAVLVPAP